MARTQYKIQEVGLYIKEKIDISKRPIVDDKLSTLEVMKKVKYFQLHLDYKEMCYVIYVNNADKLLSIIKISEGSDTNATVSIKQIMQGALLQNAVGMILVHNHPSGNEKPSDKDIKLTNRVRKCAKMFDIELIDHIIITPDDSYSFEEDYSPKKQKQTFIENIIDETEKIERDILKKQLKENEDFYKKMLDEELLFERD
ncbi:MAG: JAB domain-containing protein [Marinilabiliaceae bacterium]|nr:JAB domain-containing protein [Marinilabiliaceae bacterium]